MLTKWSILFFFLVYVGIQVFLIGRAHFSPDKRFGFWMFAETTFFSAELYRITKDGQKIKTRNGKWVIRDNGSRVFYSWNRFVREYRLYNLETRKRAKGSMNRTLKFFDAALDYVIERIPEDPETIQLVLEVTFQKAGEKTQKVTLESKQKR